MTTSVLIIHWEDLLNHGFTGEPPRAFVLHALRKQARLRHGARSTLILGTWAQAAATVAELQGLGCRLYNEEEVEGNLGALFPSSRPKQAVLVMDEERAARWSALLAQEQCASELWYTGQRGPAGAAACLAELVDQVGLSSVALFVDTHHLRDGFRHLSVPPDIPHAAASLLRRAGLLGDVLDARLYGNWSSDEATSLAARLDHAGRDGLSGAIQLRYQPPGETPPASDTLLGDLQGLLEAPHAPHTWVLVANHPVVVHLAAEARRRGIRTFLWAADTEAVSTELRCAVDHFVPLQTVLDLRAQTVALYIDYENVARSLSKQGFVIDPSTLARGLIERAHSFGRVGEARAYADWDQFLEHREADGRIVRRGAQRAFREAGIDTVYVLPGPNSADLQLARDVESALGAEECPDNILLASGDGDFCATVDGIRRRGKDVWVWSVRSATRAELLSRATQHEWIEDFLNLEATPGRAVTASRVSVIAREWDDTGREERPAADTTEIGSGSRISPWVRMLYQIERLLRANHWSKAAFRRLAAHLATIEEFGPTPANAMMWLNRAKAEGMLIVDQEAHRADRAIRITTCRLNPEHPSARAALEVPDRVIRLLYQMLQKMPWVSFKLLRNVLLREQWLGGTPHCLEEGSIDEWVNYLVADGALAMSKEPNAENPEYPVTALRLNDEHPLTSAVVHQAVVGTRLAAERAILAVDHFLVRNGKPWMAMSALRRALDGIGREELQEVLQGLQNLGALLTDSYPNPQKEHFTTGCALNPEVPVVRDALQIRNGIIHVVQYLQRHRSWIPLAKVDEELALNLWGSAHPNQRLAWFSLLRDEAILEMDHEGPLPPNAWGNVHCRLKVTDAVVRAVVAANPASGAEWPNGPQRPTGRGDSRPEGSRTARPDPPPAQPAALGP
jgi:hypothetical protein